MEIWKIQFVNSWQLVQKIDKTYRALNIFQFVFDYVSFPFAVRIIPFSSHIEWLWLMLRYFAQISNSFWWTYGSILFTDAHGIAHKKTIFNFRYCFSFSFFLSVYFSLFLCCQFYMNLVDVRSSMKPITSVATGNYEMEKLLTFLLSYHLDCVNLSRLSISFGFLKSIFSNIVNNYLFIL